MWNLGVFFFQAVLVCWCGMKVIFVSIVMLVWNFRLFLSGSFSVEFKAIFVCIIMMVWNLGHFCLYY